MSMQSKSKKVAGRKGRLIGYTAIGVVSSLIVYFAVMIVITLISL